MAPGRYIKIHIILATLNVLFAAEAFSQIRSECDLKFIDHLIKTTNYKEALFLLNSDNCLSYRMNDSVYYYRGMALYFLNEMDSSAACFINISSASALYPQSHFLAAYDWTYSGKYNQAEMILEKTELNNDKLISLKNFQIAGINLIQGNLPVFHQWLNKTDTSFKEIAGSSSKLLKISTEIMNHKGKSQFAAGLMSSIIPGSGKLYAGKRGSAISAFLTTVGLGLVTWESYRKTGLNSFRTIGFGTIFVFSYAANIYGSTVSVKISENEYKEHVKSSILFNLHLSVSNIFGR